MTTTYWVTVTSGINPVDYGGNWVDTAVTREEIEQTAAQDPNFTGPLTWTSETTATIPGLDWDREAEDEVATTYYLTLRAS